jgi:transcriptional repressor NrdR
MKCPFCNAEDTKVIDSRPADDNTAIRRRRQCESCGQRFTTYEKVETIPMMVIKKDNSRVPYDRSKIEAGIVRSCHKRPISTQQINQIVDEIENEIFSNNEREVPTSQIGELVMQKLKAVDQVAYVRFASVYREFKDINTFVDEIGKLLKSQESK